MTSRSRYRHVLLPALVITGALIAAWGIARVWRTQASTIAIDDVRWSFAALALALLLCFVVLYAACWAQLARAIEDGDVRRQSAMRLFLLTWPGRYAPASVLYYGGRLAGSRSIGLGRGAAAASFVYENVFALAASGLVSILLLLLHARRSFDAGPWTVAAVVAALLALACLHPSVPRTAIRLGSRRIKRLAPLEDHVLAGPDAMLIGSGYVIGSLLVGLAFWAALRAFGAETSPLLAIAVYNLAGAAGMLAIFIPSGIGVREGVAVALLAGIISPPVALSAAVLTRLAGVLADVLPLMAIVAFEAVAKAWRWRSPPAIHARGDAR